MSGIVLSVCLLFGAAVTTEVCPECQGKKSFTEKVTCDVCGGKGYTGIAPVIKCTKCSKVRTQSVTIGGKVVVVGVGEVSKKTTCKRCNGKGRVAVGEAQPAAEEMQVVELTRMQLQKITALLDLNGEVVLKKANLKLVLKDASGAVTGALDDL